MNKEAENYFTQGCGRCAKGGTPACKVHIWAPVLALLREIATDSGLQEACKWGVPVYTLDGKNVFLITCMNDYACISFFKGALLTDPGGVLVAPGPNSQADRQVRITTLAEFDAHRPAIQALIRQAITLEAAGKTIAFDAKHTIELPEELLGVFLTDAELEQAFINLTPGRQRGYVLHITAAKQPATRMARIQKCRPGILAGRGLNDR